MSRLGRRVGLVLLGSLLAISGISLTIPANAEPGITDPDSSETTEPQPSSTPTAKPSTPTPTPSTSTPTATPTSDETPTATPTSTLTPTPTPTSTTTANPFAGAAITELRKQLDTLEAEQQDLAAQKLTIQERLKAARSQLTTTQAQIDAQKEAMSSLADQLGNIALQQYQDRGLNSTVRLMASPTAEDLLSYMAMMQQVTDTTNSLVTALIFEQSALLDLQRSEQTAVSSVSKEKKALETLESKAKARVEKTTQLLDEMTRAAAANTTAVRAGGYGSSDAARHGVANPAKAVPNPSTSMISPMRKYTITDGYGMRNNPFTGAYSFHDALDMAAPCGTPIYAPANGFVIDYYWAGGYGNRMVVDHGFINGRHVVTSFNHLSAGIANPGSSVLQGTLLALVGTTGSSTGCHLHYMIWINGETVNPANYI